MNHNPSTESSRYCLSHFYEPLSLGIYGVSLTVVGFYSFVSHRKMKKQVSSGWLSALHFNFSKILADEVTCKRAGLCFCREN
nr:hypothetical protein [Tanacetum cinerariifolium]